MKQLLASLLLLLALALAACGGTTTTAEPTATAAREAAPAPAGPQIKLDEGEPLRVAFVYVAPIGEMGWTWAHEQGRLMVEEQFGDRVETAHLDSVPEGPEAEGAIRDFAEQGYHIIFTTSFGFLEPTLKVASEFPNTWFVHVSGDQTAPNVSTMFGRMEVARYLSGIAAGAATEADQIGYVAAFPLPEVVRGLNAFTLGVRAINPDAEVRVRYTDTWFGPPEERAAALALLAEGADVIAQHQDTAEPQKAAQEEGALSIGYNGDMRAVVGDTVLTSAVWNWGIKYVDIVGKVLNGIYRSEAYYGDHIVGLAPFSPLVDARIVAIIEEQDTAIRSGRADVFCGPIRANTGELVIEEGRCLSDAELFAMDWYVEGVIGDAPAAAREGLGEASDKVPAWTVSQ